MRLTAPYGRRLDPITGEVSRHGGIDLVGVIAVENGDGLQCGDAQLFLQGLAHALGLNIEAGLLLGVAAKNTHVRFLHIFLVMEKSS
jgi:hypothetical protein